MIVRRVLLIALAASAAAASAQPPTPASVRVTPHARALFERDWVLMNWALKFFGFRRRRTGHAAGICRRARIHSHAGLIPIRLGRSAG